VKGNECVVKGGKKGKKVGERRGGSIESLGHNEEEKEKSGHQLSECPCQPGTEFPYMFP